MFDQLKSLIKEEENFQKQFAAIEAKYFEDKKRYERMLIKKARMQALVMASVIVIGILSVVYSINLKTVYEERITEMETKMTQTEERLEACLNK